MAKTCVKCEKPESQDNPFCYSGIDAFVMGVMEHVEKICYSCAADIHTKNSVKSSN